MVGPPPPAFTVTVTAREVLPAALIAVSVYVVVVAGETFCDPLACTVPSELMLTEVAFWTLHWSVELCPALIVAGVAVKLAITGAPEPTVTTMLHVVDAPPPVAVTVYVVVVAGLTETEPLLATGPTLGEILTVSALRLIQESVEDWPAEIVDGVAVQPISAGPVGRPSTWTVTVVVSSFTLLRAVSVYVVVCRGETVVDPFTATFPMPVMLTVSAFCVFQESVTAWPAMICFGSARKNSTWARSAERVEIRTRACPCPP